MRDPCRLIPWTTMRDRPRRRTRRDGVLAIAASLVVGACAANGYAARAALRRPGGRHAGTARAARVARDQRVIVRTPALTVHGAAATLRARLYRSARIDPPTHAASSRACTRRAWTSRGWRSSHATSPSVRHTVLTIELTDLQQYRITPRTTDMIEDAAAVALATARSCARRPRRA